MGNRDGKETRLASSKVMASHPDSHPDEVHANEIHSYKARSDKARSERSHPDGAGEKSPSAPLKARGKGDPAKLSTYIKSEKWLLVLITITGIVYNAGMTAGPWFEGQLAQYLADILQGLRLPVEMVQLAIAYVIVIAIVQGCRALKRLYVRYFANNINRSMKGNLYHALVHETPRQMRTQNSGELLTKAISDVDTCVEGIRKFTTEVFDTGVVMIAYSVMLLVYDWRLALISMVFPPISYVIAQKMRKRVAKASREAKESSGRLSSRTLDRAKNALAYRIYGEERTQEKAYESALDDYEHKNVRSGILEGSMEPLYRAVSMLSIFFILWLGGRNVLGIGWTAWDIAAFTAFLSCFIKLATKSSHAAKLFNSVQKAKVSWERIQPLMCEVPRESASIENASIENASIENAPCVLPETMQEPQGLRGSLDPQGSPGSQLLVADGASFAYPEGPVILRDVSFAIAPGQIMGVTGAVASGKTTLGKMLLCEYEYGGSITFGGCELSDLADFPDTYPVGYLGHSSELFSDTIENNVAMGLLPGASVGGGASASVEEPLQDVCFDKDFESMPLREQTQIGDSGIKLSGGQQKRVAIARTLYHYHPVMVLDDPFASVDKATEQQILDNLRSRYSDRAIILISHRLSCFPSLDSVLFIENGSTTLSTHDGLMESNGSYRKLYELQSRGGDLDEQ